MDERRRYERVAYFCPLRLTVLPDGPEISGNAFDISIGGVGLVAPVFLERGREVLVHFLMKDAEQSESEESIMGRVAYSQADEDGNRIGVEFVKPVQESAQPLLARRLYCL